VLRIKSSKKINIHPVGYSVGSGMDNKIKKSNGVNFKNYKKWQSEFLSNQPSLWLASLTNTITWKRKALFKAACTFLNFIRQRLREQRQQRFLHLLTGSGYGCSLPRWTA
jgi:hypothetical protein